MKSFLSKAILALFLSFAPISVAFAQENVGDFCQRVGSTAGNIALSYESGKTIVDLNKEIDSDEFRALPEDVQELVKALIKIVFRFGPELSAQDHFMGAMQSCISFNGNLKEMTDYFNKWLEENTI